MDGEEFFDRLYSRFYIPFPCHVVLRDFGQGFACEKAADGTAALVVLTDEHLVERFLTNPDAGKPFPLKLAGPEQLARLLNRLPPSFTHVAFDPNPQFHRRYEIGLIRELLADAARAA